MPHRGRRFIFHGAFATKAKAERRHKRVRRSFILRRRIRGKTRYLVVKPRRR